MDNIINQKKSIEYEPKEIIHLDCICGETQSIEYFDFFKQTGKFKGFKLVKCVKCDLVRTDPSPISSGSDAEDLYDDPHYYSLSAQETDFWIDMAKKSLKDLEFIQKRGKLLDVGCGLGYMVKVAKDMGFDAYGIEMNPHPIPIGKKLFNINIEQKSLNEVNEKFDVIISNHVIEHVLSPKDFLSEMGERLNDGGHIYLGVPNIQGGIPKTLRLFNKLKKGPGANWLWVGYQPKEHIWHFSLKTFTDFLEREGWEVMKSRSNLNNSYAYAKVPKLRQRIIQKLWKTYEFFNRADEFTVVCRKKK